MIIEKNQIFNLMDTNGRRSDVLNALKIYLEILEELKNMYPKEYWGKYPNSLAQFLFYQKALEKSKDVFKTHRNYDRFIRELGDEYQTFIDRDDEWVKNNIPQYASVLDESVEKRSRHYTSNLVKMGFTSSNRNITEAGYSYLRGTITRDAFEDVLPLDNINIALIRQLAKLKIFSTPDNKGKRQFYSPFLMALTLLLDNEPIDKSAFEIIVQGLTPYSNDTIKNEISDNTISISELEESIQDISFDIPDQLIGKTDIEYDVFQTFFKGSKNNDSTSAIYFEFFCSLKSFRDNRSVESYNNLINCFDNNASMLNKAFGYGKSIFNMGNKGSRFDIEKFIKKNNKHYLLSSDDFIKEFYAAFVKSKWIDGIREYSDTTMRLLSATGLFKFKNLPDLSYKEVLSLFFESEQIRKNVFGEMSEEEFIEYEIAEDCYYGASTSLSRIFGYSHDVLSSILDKIQSNLGSTDIIAIP